MRDDVRFARIQHPPFTAAYIFGEQRRLIGGA